MRGVSIAAVLLASALAQNVAFAGLLPPRPHPGAPPHLGAPAPLIGSWLGLLLVGGTGGMYWLVRRRRRDSDVR